MANPNMIILYVTEPVVSTAFYEKLLGHAPAYAAPNFVSFPLQGGFSLGLWRQDTVDGPVRSEVVFAIDGENGVAKAYEDWKAAGHTIVQPLTAMDFGPTFVVADPDGHRLRVCEPDKD